MADIFSDAAAWLTNSLGLTKKIDRPAGGTGTTNGLADNIALGANAPIKKPITATPNTIASTFSGAADLEAANRQLAATNAEIAARPKLLYRDTNAAWQQAKNSAASSVNPVYQDNLNRKLAEIAATRAQQTATTAAAKTASDTSLTNTNEDIATNRTRTTEDTASAIAQNLQNEGDWQTTEGRDAAATEDAARLALGDQGMAGRGAGQLETAKIVRNEGSDKQTKAFEQDRQTKELLKTRTFQDLDTKGVRAVQMNTTEKADLDRSLNDFITNQGLEEQDFRAKNEAERLNAVFGATTQQYKTDTAAWLDSLYKGGARQQDVALATQIYGGA